jgi:hypothetical protein
MLAHDDRRPTDPDNLLFTWKAPRWEVVYPDQEAANARVWERCFFHGEVQGDDPDDSIGKLSKRIIVVMTSEDVPPLVAKVVEYLMDERLAPLYALRVDPRASDRPLGYRPARYSGARLYMCSVFSEWLRWLVRLQIGNGNGTLANKVQRNPKLAIALVQSQNIALKVKGPGRFNPIRSDVLLVKGINDVVPRMPFPGNPRVQRIKGGFYVSISTFPPSMPDQDGYYAPFFFPTSKFEHNASIAESAVKGCAAK